MTRTDLDTELARLLDTGDGKIIRGVALRAALGRVADYLDGRVPPPPGEEYTAGVAAEYLPPNHSLGIFPTYCLGLDVWEDESWRLTLEVVPQGLSGNQRIIGFRLGFEFGYGWDYDVNPQLFDWYADFEIMPDKANIIRAIVPQESMDEFAISGVVSLIDGQPDASLYVFPIFEEEGNVYICGNGPNYLSSLVRTVDVGLYHHSGTIRADVSWAPPRDPDEGKGFIRLRDGAGRLLKEVEAWNGDTVNFGPVEDFPSLYVGAWVYVEMFPGKQNPETGAWEPYTKGRKIYTRVEQR